MRSARSRISSKTPDAEGRLLDFHGLRHCYISWLVNSGAPVSVCQSLARHSTPMLTLGVYTHVRLADTSKALLSLPMPTATPAGKPEALRATGTDAAVQLPDAVAGRIGGGTEGTANISTKVHAQLAHKTCGVLGGNTACLGGQETGGGQMGEGAETPVIMRASAQLQGENATGRSGIRTHDKRICNPPH